MTSELIAELQKQMDLHGDRKVGVIMDERQDRTADEITRVWPFSVSDRYSRIIIDCKSVCGPRD